MVVIPVMYGQFAEVLERKFAGTATTNPGIHLESLFPIPSFPVFLVTSGIGYDLIESVAVNGGFSGTHDCSGLEQSRS